MIKSLGVAIDKVLRLTVEQQAYAAHVLEQIALDDGQPFEVPSDHHGAILEGLSQAQRGEFASAASVERLLRTPWT